MLSETRLTRDLSGNESIMKENKETKWEIDVAWNPLKLAKREKPKYSCRDCLDIKPRT